MIARRTAVNGREVNCGLTTRVSGRMIRNMASLSEQAALSQLEQRLTSSYVGVSADRIEAAVRTAHARFEHSKIRDFVPLLVERRARDELANS